MKLANEPGRFGVVHVLNRFLILQDFKPRIHVSESDFATITLEGELCNSSGKLGRDHFEAVFRRMLKLYTQRQVQTYLSWRAPP